MIPLSLCIFSVIHTIVSRRSFALYQPAYRQKKIAEYDADILNMVAEGKADVYLSADDAMNDIFGTHDIYSNRTKSN